ncbi:Predicted acetyltransferase [Blastococcus aggregatus]|uniref:Predicted acetyltransferase n=1 Tax=Blastococcus aggregatus TaxID=38502 RepID=A0A285V0W5_9ACTN|nr:GNAT family N-acetyltransferase [Blastococcus aggregatus]SOC46171.1 Predicted acetyltransferase [Blastococcus aggregatus]
MSIDVSPATEDEKSVVRRLLELNSHDFSEFDGRDLGPTGEYGYRYLDHYWIENEDRHAFIVRVDRAIAGCVLVRAGSPHRFGEFFIVRKHRRSGVGTTVAHAIFGRFPGEWLVEEIPGNDAAVAFWRRAIPVDFQDAQATSGTSQRFVSRAH